MSFVASHVTMKFDLSWSWAMTKFLNLGREGRPGVRRDPSTNIQLSSRTGDRKNKNKNSLFNRFTWSTLQVLPQFLPLLQQSLGCSSLWTPCLLLERTPQIHPVKRLEDTEKDLARELVLKVRWTRSPFGLHNNPIMQSAAFVSSIRKPHESQQTHPGVVLDEPVLLLLDQVCGDLLGHGLYALLLALLLLVPGHDGPQCQQAGNATPVGGSVWKYLLGHIADKAHVISPLV